MNVALSCSADIAKWPYVSIIFRQFFVSVYITVHCIAIFGSTIFKIKTVNLEYENFNLIIIIIIFFLYLYELKLCYPTQI